MKITKIVLATLALFIFYGCSSKNKAELYNKPEFGRG